MIHVTFLMAASAQFDSNHTLHMIRIRQFFSIFQLAMLDLI